MKKTDVRFALIGGLGRRGQKLIDVISMIGKLAAVVDPSVGKSAEIDLPCPVFPCIEQAFRATEFDCWVVAIPHDMQASR